MDFKTAIAHSPKPACRTGNLSAALLKGGKALLSALIIVGTLGFDTTDARAASQSSYVVQNDRGGLIRDRLVELRNLRASGQRVEIRGQICYSTCTILLGLPNTCISPETQFGFHGPSKNGRQLAPDRFEYYSRVIAQYYPKQLNSWYMKTGRNRIKGVHRIKGRDIIQMGIKAC